MSLWHLAYTCLAKGKYDCTKVDKSGQFANICQIFNNVAADLFSGLKSKFRLVCHSLHWPMQCNAGRLNDWIFFPFFETLKGWLVTLAASQWPDEPKLRASHGASAIRFCFCFGIILQFISKPCLRFSGSLNRYCPYSSFIFI